MFILNVHGSGVNMYSRMSLVMARFSTLVIVVVGTIIWEIIALICQEDLFGELLLIMMVQRRCPLG